MTNNHRQTTLVCIIALLLLTGTSLFGQCPEFTDNTLSGGCFNGGTPCDLCPGEILTLGADGNYLPDGGCVNWYYSTDPGFNPYNGEGTFIACGDITTSYPNCTPCPELLGIQVDACGTEQLNEYMIVSSGAGFNVNNFQVDFATQNNTGGAPNADINFGPSPCGWKVPDAATLAAIVAFNGCAGAMIVPAGPGTQIPPNSIVFVFTSSGATQSILVDDLCPNGKIYVMQSACTRTIGAFTNGNGSGLRSQGIKLAGCSCSDYVDYTCEDLAPAMDGDYVLHDGTNGNAGCLHPPVDFVPVPGITVVEDVTMETTEAMCNMGPFYIVGIISPTGPAGCNDIFTPNQFSFNVVCPEAIAGIIGPVCFGGSATLTAEGGSSYHWAGPGGYMSNLQNPVITNLNASKSGLYSVTVTNAAGCTDVASVQLTVNSDITVSITPNNPTFCIGDVITLTGSATGGSGNYTYDWNIPGGGTATGQTLDATVAGTYTLIVTDSEGCTKQKSITVNTYPSPEVDISPQPLSICPGATGTICANASNGTAPYNYSWSTGEINSCISFSTAAIVGLTVTDAHGCTVTATAEVTESTPPNVVIGPVPALFCFGSSINLTATGSSGNSPYSYNWTTPTGNQSGQVINTSTPGNYSVTITDTNGCTNKDAINVIENPDITISINPNPASYCMGGSVQLTVTATGGSGINYTYTWSTPSGTATGSVITANQPGNYKVTVTDSESCNKTAGITVTESSGLTAIIKPDPASFCIGSSVDLSGAASGGSGTYTYNWTTPTGPLSGQMIKASTIGFYYLTITDSNGCSGMDTVNVTQDSNIPVTITPDPASFCKGSSVSLTASSASGGPLIFNWSTPSGPQSGATISANLVGNYVVTVTNFNGCSGVNNVNVTETSGLSVNITPSQPSICAGGSIQISANVTGGSNLTYSWTTPSGTASGQNINANKSGTYLVTVTDAGGCTGTASVVVDDLPALNVVLDPNPASFCINGSVTITASIINGQSPYTYNWSTPAGNGSSNSFVANIAGTYAVTVTDNNGCTGTASIPVSQSNTLTLSFLPVPPGFCPGKTIDLSITANGGQAPFNYTWTSPLGNFNTQKITTGTAGSYKITVTDVNGCSGLGEVIVEELEVPSLTMAATAGFCTGKSVQVKVDATGALMPFTYAWSTPSGTQSSSSFNTNVPGTYSVIVTNKAGCTSSGSTLVNEWELPVIKYTPDPVEFCTGKTVDLNVGPEMGLPPYSYNWTGPSGNFTGNPVTISVQGNYTLSVTDTNGCSDTATILAKETPGLTVSLNTDPAQLCGVPQFNIISTTTGGNQPYQYNWTGPFGNYSTSTIAASGAGNYNLTVTDASGCTGSNDIMVVNEALSLVIDKTDPDCKDPKSGEISIISAVNSSYPMNLVINNGQAISFNSLPFEVKNLEGGLYDLNVTAANGCEYNESIELKLSTILSLNLGQDITIFSGETIALNPIANFTIDSIFWTNQATLSCEPGCLSPIAFPAVNTQYKAIAYDDQGCFAKDDINIYVVEKQSVYVPNSFSPDANGINDKWVIFSDETVKQIKKLYIFDRWGESLFLLENFPTNDQAYGWDGKFRGRYMNTGVYVYYFEAEYENGTTKTFKGDINLLR